MTRSTTPDMIAALVGLWWIAALVFAFLFAVAGPLMAWSVTRNIRGIRRELAQLNETMALPSHRP